MNKLWRSLLVTLALTLSLTANAATDIYGKLLSGTFMPSDSFASLSYDLTNAITNTYTFTLTAYDLDALFTPGAFIGAIAVDLSGPLPTISNVSGGAPVSVSPGGGPTGIYDFRFDLTGPRMARLTANEFVTFDASFSGPVVLDKDSFALHVQGLTDAQGGSAWYIVPEPETYALMLAGLGVMGFIARRRKAQMA